MNEKKSILSLDFVNYEGKNVSIKLADPKEDITAAEIQSVMELMNNIKVFHKLHGSDWVPVKIKGAKVIDTVTNEFGISVE